MPKGSEPLLSGGSPTPGGDPPPAPSSPLPPEDCTRTSHSAEPGKARGTGAFAEVLPNEQVGELGTGEGQNFAEVSGARYVISRLPPQLWLSVCGGP